MNMTQEDFILEFPVCPVCKTAVTSLEKENAAPYFTGHYLAGCGRRCLSLNYNGKFIHFEPENDRAMVYNTEDSTIEVRQTEFPYELEDLGEVSFKKMQEKVLTYKTPRHIHSALAKYFDSGL